MDPIMLSNVIANVTPVTELIGKGTVALVNTKISALKTEKDANKLRSEYDHLVENLMAERAEALRIAQAYEDELRGMKISEEEIDYLKNTISSVLDIFKELAAPGDQAKLESQTKAIETIKQLITTNTLKTMQLLGFNYKEAVGIPLTEICAESIRKLVTPADIYKSKTRKGSK